MPAIEKLLTAIIAIRAQKRDAREIDYSFNELPLYRRGGRILRRRSPASNTLRVVAAPLRLLLASVSPRLTIAALMSATLAAAVFGTMSKSIREAPPLEELTRPSTSAEGAGQSASS